MRFPPFASLTLIVATLGCAASDSPTKTPTPDPSAPAALAVTSSLEALEPGDTASIRTRLYSLGGAELSHTASCAVPLPLIVVSTAGATRAITVAPGTPLPMSPSPIAVRCTLISPSAAIVLSGEAVVRVSEPQAASAQIDSVVVVEDEEAVAGVRFLDKRGSLVTPDPTRIVFGIGADTIARLTRRSGAEIWVAGRNVGTTTLSARLSSPDMNISAEGRVHVLPAPLASFYFKIDSASVNIGSSSAVSIQGVTRAGRVARDSAITLRSGDPTTVAVRQVGPLRYIFDGIAAGDAFLISEGGGRQDSVRVTARFVGTDATPPTLTSITAGSRTVRVSTSARSVAVTVGLRDAQSAVGSVLIWYRNWGMNGPSCTAVRVSGTDRDGQWRCTLTFPQGMAPGELFPSLIVRDRASNIYADDSFVNPTPPLSLASITVTP